MEEESSWVGAGWSLNPGSITRQLRGLPDDFNGKDQIVKDINMKPEVEVGMKLRAKLEGFAIPIVNAGVSVGVFNNNYKGMGAELGVNAGISIGKLGSGPLTVGIDAGVDINSNTQKGVTLTPSVNFGIRVKASEEFQTNAGFSLSMPYNSRAGLRGPV